MGYWTRNNWIDSRAGQRARRAKRAAVQVFAHADVEPRSKNAMRDDERKAFQSALTKSLGKRRGFRSPVIVELDLFAGANNPPEIHTVAKNYMDLTYRAEAGEGRLMIDDRQVHYLAVRYFPRLAHKPSIYLRATRMSCFREDARLARSIQVDVDERWADNDARIADELSDWERRRGQIVERYGKETFDLQRRMYLTQLQQQWLAGTEHLVHATLLDLVSGALSTSVSEIDLAGVRFPAIDLDLMQRRFLLSPSISLELAPLPRRPGEGAGFRAAVGQALEEVRAFSRHLFPLLTELAVTILLVPPATGGIDLDNLARKVIPQVHAILEPPARIPLPDPATISDPRRRAFFENEARAARRLPKHHVTRYEVIALKRANTDPESGYVRLALCDGAFGRTFADFVRDTIDKWEEVESRS